MACARAPRRPASRSRDQAGDPWLALLLEWDPELLPHGDPLAARALLPPEPGRAARPRGGRLHAAAAARCAPAGRALPHTGDTAETCERAEAFFAALGLHAEWVADAPGLVLGRIVSQLVNEAAFAIGEGVGSAEDIDAGLELGLNHPRGPVAWSEAIGTFECLELLGGGLGGAARGPLPAGARAPRQAAVGGTQPARRDMATADLTVIALGRPDPSASEYIAEIQRRLAAQDRVRLSHARDGHLARGLHRGHPRGRRRAARDPVRAGRAARLHGAQARRAARPAATRRWTTRSARSRTSSSAVVACSPCSFR